MGGPRKPGKGLWRRCYTAIDSRGATKSDVCVMLGETGGVRIRTMHGAREMHGYAWGLSHAEEPDEGPVEDADRTKAIMADCRLMRSIVEDIKRSSAGRSEQLRVELAGIEDEVHQLITQVADLNAKQRAHEREGGPRLTPAEMKSRHRKQNLLIQRETRKRVVTRLLGEADAALHRLVARMANLPVRHIITRECELLRLWLDKTLGKLVPDHRPLSHQFRDMGLSDIDLKITLLEIEENIQQCTLRLKEQKSNQKSFCLKEVLTPPDSPQAAGGGLAALRRRRNKQEVSAAERFIKRRMDMTGAAPVITMPDPDNPNATVDVKFDTKLWWQNPVD